MRCGVCVKFGPAESSELVIFVMQQQAFGVEPSSCKTRGKCFGGPMALLGVVGKRAVVYFQPLGFVCANSEGTSFNVG